MKHVNERISALSEIENIDKIKTELLPKLRSFEANMDFFIK